METSLILFSGLPGSGKSLLAEAVAWHYKIPLFSKDRLQSFLIKRGLVAENTIDGYLQILDLADRQLSLGISSILDAVFPLPGYREEAYRLAERYTAVWRVIYCHCSNADLWKQRWHQRMEGEIPGESHYTTFYWSEIEALAQRYHPWQPNEALFIDSINPFEENLARVLEYLT